MGLPSWDDTFLAKVFAGEIIQIITLLVYEGLSLL